VGERGGRQPVQLPQRAVRGCVRDEVVEVVGGAGGRRGALVREGRGARERVVRGADRRAVAEALAAEVGRERRGEGLEFRERRAEGELVGLVEQDGEQGLRAAGVLDGLLREEDGLRRSRVWCAVGGELGLLLGFIAGQVFEEKDEAIDGTAELLLV